MTITRQSFRSLVAVLVALLLVDSVVAQAANVFPPKRRLPTVEMANDFLARALPGELEERPNNPFFPNQPEPEPEPVPDASGNPAPAPQPRGPSSSFELLETIAPQINPSGTLTLGGQPLLLFGQKKIREGGELPILYDGQRYTLVISAIGTSSFTLRLGEAEYTRPIKTDN